jgi:transcriptional regulator with XRE-family HTH domain
MPIAQLTHDVAWSISAKLKSAREAEGKSIKEIADKLYLSFSQVAGLESATTDSFYSVAYYARATKLYCKLFEITYLDDLIKYSEDAPHTRRASVEGKDLLQRLNGAVNNYSAYFSNAALISSAAIVFVLLIFAIKYPNTRRVEIDNEQSHRAQHVDAPITYSSASTEVDSALTVPPPSQMPVGDEVKITNKRLNRQVSETTEIKDNSSEQKGWNHIGNLEITFVAPTWCQIVLRDGSRTVKKYAEGQTISLEHDNLQAVVIGNINSVSVVSRGKEVDLGRFTSSDKKIVRLIGQSVRSLGE